MKTPTPISQNTSQDPEQIEIAIPTPPQAEDWREGIRKRIVEINGDSAGRTWIPEDHFWEELGRQKKELEEEYLSKFDEDFKGNYDNFMAREYAIKEKHKKEKEHLKKYKHYFKLTYHGEDPERAGTASGLTP